MITEFRDAVRANLGFAERLFAEISAATRDEPGVTRAAYGPGEQVAHDLIAEAARGLGLSSETDAAGNLYATLAGRDRSRPELITGSHLDSIPHGGDFDGTAGVLAGLIALAALDEAGVEPAFDLSLMAIRGEENAWFQAGHIGSRAALGTLPADLLEGAVRVDTGRRLAEHMAEAGLDPQHLGAALPHLPPETVRGFVEVHIEQGPVLVEAGKPLGVVTGIRGNRRWRAGHVVGAYDHSGAVPKAFRRDAVMAFVELAGDLDAAWEGIEAEGGDLVVTIGEVATDAEKHAITKIPGDLRFALEVRSHSAETLDGVAGLVQRRAAEIGGRRRVTFDLGPMRADEPALMDSRLRRRLSEGCRDLGIEAMDIACGAGHDAQDFVMAGIPAAMIFVRNANGSHNPDEAMEIADFALASELLAWFLANEAV